jgi:hypothetical protein
VCQWKLSASTVVSAARAAIGKILTQLVTSSCSRKLSDADSTCDRADGCSTGQRNRLDADAPTRSDITRQNTPSLSVALQSSEEYVVYTCMRIIAFVRFRRFDRHGKERIATARRGKCWGSVHHERGDRYSGEYHPPSAAQRVGQVMS